jgi:hypothetical protein
MRCGGAFYAAAAAASAAAALPLIEGAGGDAGRAMRAGRAAAPPDAGRALLLASPPLFPDAAARGEAPLAALPVSAAALTSGELVVTRSRVYFAGGLLGLRSTRCVPFDATVGVCTSAGAGTVTLTFVDDGKVASARAAKEREAERAAARLAGGGGAGSAAAALAAAAAQAKKARAEGAAKAGAAPSAEELFASVMAGGGGGLTGITGITGGGAGGGGAGGGGGSAAAPDAPLSVGDAFGDLFSFTSESAAAAAPAAPAPPAPGAGAALASAFSVPAAGSGGAPPSPPKAAPPPPAHPMLADLSPQDVLSFLSSGGSAEALSQLVVAPPAATGGEREGLFFLLQLLRQLEARPHVPHFDFSFAGTAPGAAAAKAGVPAGEPLPLLAVAPYYAWLRERAAGAEKPLLLRGAADAGALATLIGGATAKRGAAPQGAADMLDLFAAAPAPPAPQPAGAPAQPNAGERGAARAASGGTYGDLDGLGSAGDL